MKIVSWNVNGLRAVHRKGNFDWLLKQSPDIFCLQETKSELAQLSDVIHSPAGYTSYFDHSKGRKGYSGVAIYTKVKPKQVIEGMGIPEYDQEGRLLGLVFENFTLLNIYFPNGGSGPDRLEYKLEFYKHFLKFINKLRKNGHNIIFCGDVNTAHTAIDLARPKENEKNTGFLPVERAWIDEVIKNDYLDIFRDLNPELKDQYTYWDQKTFARDRNVGWRIDYFFLDKKLKPKVKKVILHSTVLGSDHCPIELDINF